MMRMMIVTMVIMIKMFMVILSTMIIMRIFVMMMIYSNCYKTISAISTVNMISYEHTIKSLSSKRIISFQITDRSVLIEFPFDCCFPFSKLGHP